MCVVTVQAGRAGGKQECGGEAGMGGRKQQR